MLNAIALVPGFLGFDHVSGFTYFADRFCAGLRMQVQELSGERVSIVPLPISPIGSLAQRQDGLLKSLHALGQEREFKNARWHLVGHSTGGVDAAMLACSHRLEAGAGQSRFSKKKLSAGNLKLGSVTTLSAPHFGTCITRAPATEMTGKRDWTWAGTKELGRVGLDAVWNRHSDDLFGMALGNVTEVGHPLRFLYHLLCDDALLRDLHPAVSSALVGDADYRAGIRIHSIASVVPRPTGAIQDKLFRDLWTLTQEITSDAPAPPPFSVGKKPHIRNPKAAAMGRLAPIDSDGVVNTIRQVLPGTFAGLVVGDHGDVMGRYRRRAYFDTKDGYLDPGIFTSGAYFGDNEFFAMIGLIANGIARAI